MFLHLSYCIRKLRPRLTDAEVFDVVKTCCDSVFAAHVGERGTAHAGKHKDDVDRVRE